MENKQQYGNSNYNRGATKLPIPNLSDCEKQLFEKIFL